MDAEVKRLIDDAKEENLNNRFVSREVLLKFLELDPNSEECEYLGKAAREIARANGNKARVGSSIGIDLAPCTANCKFCSLGECWGLVDGIYVLSDEEIMELMRDVLAKGFSHFTIRTTEFYDIDTLCKLAKKVRKEIPGAYTMSVNTGELTLDDANRLFEAGYNSAYHTLRLGEGRDTPFDPEVRIATMRAISRSNLTLGCGVDPIGIEHTNEEIVERLEFFRTLSPGAVCSMRRVNVKGTPYEGVEEVSDIRIAQIAAVIRMASGKRWNVSVHPPILKAMEWGASNVAVETGAVPRTEKHNFGKWTIYDHDTAKKMFLKAGYDI